MNLSFISGLLLGFGFSLFFLLIRNTSKQNTDREIIILRERLLFKQVEYEKVISDLKNKRIQFQDTRDELIKLRECLNTQRSQAKFFEQTRIDLKNQFIALSAEMLKGSRDSLVQSTKETLGDPLAAQLEQLKSQLIKMQKDSSEQLGALSQKTLDLSKRSDDVQNAAIQLSNALKSPNVKGRWGELNLRRLLEFVGLIPFCDFNLQPNIDSDNKTFKPDCIISIPGSKKLIIDCKAPLDSYLEALNSSDEKIKRICINDHTRKVRSHIDSLSKKDYSNRGESIYNNIDVVILYIPIEGALSMALEYDISLLEYAFKKNIILTFPTSLLAILKGLSISIQQAEISKNIDDVHRNASELYKRFILFGDKLSIVGKNIQSLGKSYNDMLASYESRILPQGRKFKDYSGQLHEPKVIEVSDIEIRKIKSKHTEII
tara:strand:- start:5569 stop:6864 length:1296 start_codon:yes stop_codon:yes gene_type:complete